MNFWNHKRHAAMGFALMLAACGPSASGVPSGAAAPAAANAMFSGAKAFDVSGEYAGTIDDSSFGKGKATAVFAQDGASVGGYLVEKQQTANLSNAVAWTLSGSELNGTAAGQSATQACVFSITAQYARKPYKLVGSYQSVHRCTGQQGTFSLKQKCRFANGSENELRPLSGPRPC